MYCTGVVAMVWIEMQRLPSLAVNMEFEGERCIAILLSRPLQKK